MGFPYPNFVLKRPDPHSALWAKPTAGENRYFPSLPYQLKSGVGCRIILIITLSCASMDSRMASEEPIQSAFFIGFIPSFEAAQLQW